MSLPGLTPKLTVWTMPISNRGRIFRYQVTMLSLTLLSVTAILCRIGKFTQDLVPQYPELLSFGRLGFQQEPYLLEEDFQWHNVQSPWVV
jgi:hypothetical protein